MDLEKLTLPNAEPSFKLRISSTGAYTCTSIQSHFPAPPPAAGVISGPRSADGILHKTGTMSVLVKEYFSQGTFVTALVASTMFLVLVDFDPCACLPNDPVKNSHCLVITHTYVELTNSQFKWRTPQR